jgi:hypothetical protein
MEMNSSGFGSEIIVNFNHNGISDGGLDWRAWPCTIDANHLPGESIRCSSDPINAPIISYRARQRSRDQPEEKKNECVRHVDDE